MNDDATETPGQELDRVAATRAWVRTSGWLMIAAAAAFALVVGCAGDLSDGGAPGTGAGGVDDDANPRDNGSQSGGTGGNMGAAQTGGAGGAAEPGAPPETETMVDFDRPHAGARYVFVANTQKDSVAAIDSTTLTIRTIEVGDAPTSLVTVPGNDIALVINVGSGDLSVVRAATAMPMVTSVALVPGVNRISVAPGGKHALVWFDAQKDGGGLGVSGSFQDVSVVRLNPNGMDQAFPLTVGFKPSAVHFSSDGRAAYIVTEDGVSIIAFENVAGPVVAPLVPLSTTVAAGQPLDVSITPDGRFALAREEGKAVITLVNLVDATRTILDLASPVTDLDLAPDGTWALAVLRAENKVVKIPLPAGFADPQLQAVTVIAELPVGQATISPDGKTAVLYTTAAQVEQVAIMDLAGVQPPRITRLRKMIRAVAISPDSLNAVVFHEKAPGSPDDKGIDVDTRIDRSFGYSALNLGTGFAKLQLTPVEPGAMAITPDSSRAFLLLRDAGSLRKAQRLNLQNFLIDEFEMGSPPLAVASLSNESKQVFVSQQHPSGRISFINWESGAVKSVTGFELNGGIIE